MSTTFDAISTADTHVAAASTSITHNNMTVGAGGNRALLVLLAFQTQGVTGVTVTWDSGGTNQACTLIGSGNTTGASGRADLYGLVAPTSGNKTLAVSWTGGSEAYCAAVAFTGVDQTGGATTFANETSTNAIASSVSLPVTTTTNDAVVAAFANFLNFGIGSVNQTQIYRDNSGAVIDGAGNYEVNGASATMTANAAGSTDWCAVGVNVTGVAAGFVPYTPVRQTGPIQAQ